MLFVTLIKFEALYFNFTKRATPPTIMAILQTIQKYQTLLAIPQTIQSEQPLPDKCYFYEISNTF